MYICLCKTNVCMFILSRDLQIFFLSELELDAGLVSHMPCVGDVPLSAVFFRFI